MKCKHDYRQLIDKDGKPRVWMLDGIRTYEFFCRKCLDMNRNNEASDYFKRNEAKELLNRKEKS